MGWFISLFIYSFILSFVIHLFIYSCIRYSFIRVFDYSFFPFVGWSIYSLSLYSFIRLIIYSCVHLLVDVFVYSLFIYSIIRLSIYSIIHFFNWLIIRYIVLFYFQGTIVDCDPQFAYLYGYTGPEEIVGLSIQHLIPAFTLPIPGQDIKKVCIPWLIIFIRTFCLLASYYICNGRVVRSVNQSLIWGLWVKACYKEWEESSRPTIYNCRWKGKGITKCGHIK